MNHLDENETGEGTNELEDFQELPEMKDLEVLLESFEDQIYSEVFDGLMYEQVTSLMTCSLNKAFRAVWKRKKMEGQQGHSPCLLHGDKRSM